MSLPGRQRRVLNRIERTLLADDLWFGSLFTIFTRLTSPEAMPRIEQVQVTAGRRHLEPLAPVAFIAVFLVLGVCVAMLGW